MAKRNGKTDAEQKIKKALILVKQILSSLKNSEVQQQTKRIKKKLKKKRHLKIKANGTECNKKAVGLILKGLGFLSKETRDRLKKYLNSSLLRRQSPCPS
ncbi:hypothetical protein Q73_01445 [Bacillus coahuilensis m2-6]|nr:hypothetical protein Q73_01445 [Bacillus coahuilensis m2-6]